MPAEDTYLLEDCIAGRSGDAALDMGCGTGYISRALGRSFGTVVGTDVDMLSLRGGSMDRTVCCTGADALSCTFDLIVCNPPYLATDGILDRSTDGGRLGLEVPGRMVRSAAPLLKRGGSMLVVTSSLSDYAALMGVASSCGLECTICARKKLFFEELIVIEAVRP
ncbi:methylase of polypeptide chain release factor [Cenarchaeum symbiosum A]|uniref:Methylase of polypeptide chain release factor n=1 Tax=Cenarchaeum symbiosum (strain A) TaxID=414004 RepID=A0RUT7_CENSY|nr:methylase of polypeptide chain release factor [Cenarchaeum symbiosum A]